MRNEELRSTSDMSSDHPSCLLCHANQTREVDCVSAARLQQAYREELDVVVACPLESIRYLACASCGLRFFWPVFTGDAGFYRDLQRIPWYYNAGKQEFKIAARYIQSTHDVLEIGAGRGLFSREIQVRTYTGLEFSPAAIELAARDGIQLQAESVEEHAQRNGCRYDVVCAFQVLEHVADPSAFLKAAVQCLRPGGRLIVSVPGEDSFAGFAYWDVLNMPPHHVTRWTDDCLRKVAGLHGLQLLDLVAEPLGRNMRRAYARAVVERGIADRLHLTLRLLDERIKRPGFSAIATIAASLLRRYLALTPKRGRRGHAVLAVYACGTP